MSKLPRNLVSMIEARDLKGLPGVSVKDMTKDGLALPKEWTVDFLATIRARSIARRYGARIAIAPDGGGGVDIGMPASAEAEKIAEGGSYQDHLVGEIVGKAWALTKIGGRVLVSESGTEEFINSAWATFQEIAALSAARGENRYFISGTGDGEPRGIFAEAASFVTASASAIAADELEELDRSIEEEWESVADIVTSGADYRGPVYVCHKSTLEKLRGITGLEDPRKKFTLRGRPVIVAASAPAFAAGAKVLALVNWEGYLLFTRRYDLALHKSLDLNTLQQKWDFAERVDGKVWDSSACKVLALHA